MNDPKIVAMETARRLTQYPEILVAATAWSYPETAELATQELANQIEHAIRKCLTN